MQKSFQGHFDKIQPPLVRISGQIVSLILAENFESRSPMGAKFSSKSDPIMAELWSQQLNPVRKQFGKLAHSAERPVECPGDFSVREAIVQLIGR